MPNPTRRQRERVVELLRCAADRSLNSSYAAPVAGAASDIYGSLSEAGEVFDLASVARRIQAPGGYAMLLLEAAARIEEGWWPHG